MVYRQYVRRYGLHDDDDLDDNGNDEETLQRGGGRPPRSPRLDNLVDDYRTEERLARTYAVIYGPTETYMEAEETRTWLWLCFALLINVVCIRIELLLFENLMDEDNDDDNDGSIATATGKVAGMIINGTPNGTTLRAPSFYRRSTFQ